ncbi:hypothetical protein AAG906_027169 [Vitis piasezkii]
MSWWRVPQADCEECGAERPFYGCEWEALTFFGWIREDGRYVYLQKDSFGCFRRKACAPLMASAPPPFSIIISTPPPINITPWRHSKQEVPINPSKNTLVLLPTFPSFYVQPCRPAATATALTRASACKCPIYSYWKKGNGYGIDIVETEKSYVATVVMEVPAAQHEGSCKCGDSCACIDCTCGQ